MTAIVERLSKSEIRERKRGLLKSVGMAAAELSIKADRYLLDNEERSIFEQVEDLEYLEHAGGQ